MTDTKFTPGPWGIEETRDHLWIGVILSNGKPDPIVTYVDHGPDFTTEADATGKANAHLIAAAPELYEALDELFDLLTSGHSSWDDAYDNLPDKQFKKIRAALAKARGET